MIRGMRRLNCMYRQKAREQMADSQNIGDREKLVKRTVDAKKLKVGYSGSLPRSRSTSPAPSYKLSPSTTLVDWSEAGKFNSPSSSRNSSVTSFLAPPQPVKKKPSPLRLESLHPGSKHSPTTSFGGIGGAYISPLPSSRSFHSTKSQGVGGWVSPLDVHFSRPTTPSENGQTTPTSFLPQLQGPKEVVSNSLLVPTAAGATSRRAPVSGPVITKDALSKQITNHWLAEPSPPETPIISAFPTPVSSPGSRQRSIFPASSDNNRPSSRRSTKSFKDGTISALPSSPGYFPPLSPGLAQYSTPRSPRWNSEAVIRDSIVSKKTVSVYRPSSTVAQLTDATQNHTRVHSRAVSSIYSARTSILVESETSDLGSRRRSRSSEARPDATERARISYSFTDRQRHSRGFSESSTQDLRRRSEVLQTTSQDTSQAHRGREMSIEAKLNDSDQPKESPFSNSNAISTHTASSSISSAHAPRRVEHHIPKPFLELNFHDSERLSVATPRIGRNRSTSELSQVSIGDFYDSYYRQSILAQRASMASQAQEAGGRPWDASNMTSVPGGIRRPAALNLKLGGGALAEETIVEMPSPGLSPMSRSGGERGPAMF